jgi:hypothetical protein
MSWHPRPKEALTPAPVPPTTPPWTLALMAAGPWALALGWLAAWAMGWVSWTPVLL